MPQVSQELKEQQDQQVQEVPQDLKVPKEHLEQQDLLERLVDKEPKVLKVV